MRRPADLFAGLFGDKGADRVVPPSGAAARLTLFTAAAMAFVTVFALALAMASGQLAQRWSTALAHSATVRISAPADQMAAQTSRVLAILGQTPGVVSAKPLDVAQERKLLEPWFGPDLPLDALPIPQLVDVRETLQGVDAAGLRQRLAAEVPGAVFDDHSRWRRPLVAAADRLRQIGIVSIALLGAAMAAMITLAANAALAGNAQVIGVLRLIGARDVFIARAFVRRFTLRALAGSALGTGAAMVAIALFPQSAAPASFLTGLGFRGVDWLVPLLVPGVAAVVGFFATRYAAFRALRRLS